MVIGRARDPGDIWIFHLDLYVEPLNSIRCFGNGLVCLMQCTWLVVSSPSATVSVRLIGSSGLLSSKLIINSIFPRRTNPSKRIIHYVGWKCIPLKWIYQICWILDIFVQRTYPPITNCAASGATIIPHNTVTHKFYGKQYKCKQ